MISGLLQLQDIIGPGFITQNKIEILSCIPGKTSFFELNTPAFWKVSILDVYDFFLMVLLVEWSCYEKFNVTIAKAYYIMPLDEPGGGGG